MGEDGGGARWWKIRLEPYYKDPEMLLCPMATEPYSPEGNARKGSPFGAWPVSGTDDFSSYGPNGWLCNATEEDEGLGWWSQGETENHWRRLDVKGAGYIPVFLDCALHDGWPYHNDPPPAKEYDTRATNLRDEMKRFCVNRHNGFVNGVFLDDSVKKIGLKELWKLKWHRNFNVNGPWTIAGFGGNAAACAAAWDEEALWMKNFPEY
jgi:hypothetical protein